MEINSLDQLVRADQSGSAAARRSSDATEKRFANLLDAQSAKARVERPAQRPAETPRREDDVQAKTARPERARPTEKTERDDKPVRAERAERPAKEGRAEHSRKVDRAGKIADDKAGAGTCDEVEASDAADIDTKLASADVADDSEAKDDAPALPVAADPAAAAVAETVAIEAPVAALVAPVVETKDAEPMPAVQTAAAPVSAAGADPDLAAQSKLAADAKAAKAAAASQIALPTSTLAETAKSAEPETEDYADFMLRNAAAASAPASGEAAKDAAKADTKPEADLKDGKTIVTVAQPAAIAAPVAPVTAFAVQAVVSNDNAALDASLPGKAATIDADDAKAPAAKPADPNGLFAQTLDQTRNAQPVAEARQAPRAPVVPAHEQVAVQIRKAVDDGLDQIRIHLNPVELGRIDIKLDVRADGTLRAAFAADRQQTLELLKHDSRQLENALSEAGLRADAGGLNFSLRGDNRENAQAFRDMGAQYANRRGDAPADDAAPAPVAAATYARRRTASGGVDLNA